MPSRPALTLATVLAAGCLLCCCEDRERPAQPAPDLSHQLGAIHAEIQALRTVVAARATPAPPATRAQFLQVEMVDAGPLDPYAHGPSEAMTFVATHWRDRTRKQAVNERIAQLRQRGHAALKGVIPFLRSADSDARIAALNVLRELGPAAHGALTYIIERRKDPDAAVRAAAADALCAIEYMPR